jgi:hypothetical protein
LCPRCSIERNTVGRKKTARRISSVSPSSAAAARTEERRARVLMECGRAETQDVLVIDDASGIIRRHESMSISRPSPAWQLPNSVSENVVTYDSEFDIADATSMIKELEKQPW